MSKRTIAVDWDGTLVEYHGYKGAGVYGPPIPLMVERVKSWLAEGCEVLIFTSRVSVEHEPSTVLIECEALYSALINMGLPPLQFTANKYTRITEFWDDRAVSILRNTGRLRNEDLGTIPRA
jgi:hypothetical protein